MNEKAAKEIMEALAWMSMSIDLLGRRIGDFAKGEERDKFKDLFSEVYISFENVMREIVAQHKNLDPIGEGDDWWHSMRQKFQTNEYPAYRLTPEEIFSAEGAGMQAADEIQREMDKDA